MRFCTDIDEPLCYPSGVQSTGIAERIKKLKDEIETINQANREYRIERPGNVARKFYEDRRSRLVQIQQELRELLKTQ